MTMPITMNIRTALLALLTVAFLASAQQCATDRHSSKSVRKSAMHRYGYKKKDCGCTK